MAHFAKINSDNIVIHISAVTNEKLLNEDGTELEANGITHQERHGVENGFYWKQTSYNTRSGEHLLGGTPLRKNYAGIGYIYDENRDAFIPPQPYDSWLLDEPTCTWEAPVPKPEGDYWWNEETQAWDLVEE
tara:strand:- start:4 stop:399 length:396 start_codon:yes stop_codon:yes gene_type:complete